MLRGNPEVDIAECHEGKEEETAGTEDIEDGAGSVLRWDVFTAHDAPINRGEDGGGEEGDNRGKTEEGEKVFDAKENDEGRAGAAEEEPEGLEGSKAIFLGGGDKGTGGGEGAGVTVNAGQAGTEHGGKGGTEDEPTGPFADGLGIEGDQLLGECHAAGGKGLSAAKKDKGTQR